jgi:hypothetical protein
MGWAGPFHLADGRMGGYAVQAVCDQEGCEEKIDRGLAYVCGDMHDGDEHSCGRYFCASHLFMGVGLPNQMCEACAETFERENPEKVAAALAEFEAARERWTSAGKDCPRCHGARSVQTGDPDEFGNIDYDDCPLCAVPS